MKICFITNSEFSHVNPIIYLIGKIKKVYPDCKVGVCIARSEQRLFYEKYGDSIEYIFYDEKMILENQKMVQEEFSQYDGQEFDANKPLLKLASNHLDILRYVFRASDNYYHNIIDKVSIFNPDIIYRDSCSVFGRKIADELNVPIIGYTTMLTLPEHQVKFDIKKTMMLVLGRLFETNSKSELEKVYEYLNIGISKLCSEFNIRRLPITFMNDPHEQLNISFSFPLYENKEEENIYLYYKPIIFEDDYESSKDVEFHNNKNNIIISSGSINIFPLWLYERSINALKDEDYNVHISLKLFSSNIMKLNNIPNNIYFGKKIKQLSLLENAELFISHGGFNSVMEAIYYEVPMVIMPIQNDQLLNSEIVLENSIGKRISFDIPLSSLEIEKILFEILDNTSYKYNIKIIKEKIMALDSISIFLTKKIMEKYIYENKL